MRNFNSRLLVGSAYVLVTVLAVLTHMVTAGIYIWLIQVFCLYEFYRITIKPKSAKAIVLPLIIGSILFFFTYVNQDAVINLSALLWYLIPLLVFFLIYLIAYPSENFISDAGKMVLGWLYISVTFAFLLRIGNLGFKTDSTELLPYNGMQIVLVFILIWVNDTFAYLVGRKFGKTKLAPKLSPKKSVEGFVGGIVFSIAFAILLHKFFPLFDVIHFIALALICSIIGTLGDLFESRIKRQLGIKDSGTALGGHGGFLDRMDSIIMASPACFFYLCHFTVG
ncbi:MAG: phosphatidate cytidylyltransferase [Bacteroidia bacterium]|jgi:phosphatidate cytidylyltransferase